MISKLDYKNVAKAKLSETLIELAGIEIDLGFLRRALLAGKGRTLAGDSPLEKIVSQQERVIQERRARVEYYEQYIKELK